MAAASICTRGALLGLVLAAAIAPAAHAELLVRGAAGEHAAVASSRALLAVAAPASGARIRVTLRPTTAAPRSRSLPARVAGVRRVLAAVDGANRTTVAWQGAQLRAYAVTLDARGRTVAPVARIPLGPAMRLTGLRAGARRTLLTATVDELLQRPRGYCAPAGGQFAGETTFGALKTAGGRFGRPTDTRTGDYPGGTALVGDTALVADGSGDLSALASTTGPRGGRCTPWQARRTLAGAGIRSYAAIAAGPDGTLAAAGLRAPGPFVGTGDEEEDPPTPAPQPLRLAVQAPGSAQRTLDLGPGTAPAVAVRPNGGPLVAWLDGPPPLAFGGGGTALPTTLLLASVGVGPAVGVPVDGMVADPSRASVPQVAASFRNEVAVLEAAGRWRLSRSGRGGTSATQDLGPVEAGTSIELMPVRADLALVVRSSRGLEVTDVASVPPA